MLFPRWGRPLSLGQLNLRGYVAPQGPILAHAPWPEVIVTKALSDDGQSLSLVVEPYRGSGTHRFELKALCPRGEYRLCGSGVDLAITADSEGMAAFDVHVSGRLDLRLEPAHG
jgi:hypothetical protein